MRPYYQDEFATIYHGDCMEIIAAGGCHGVDALVTDPPYGIDYGRAGGFSASHGWATRRECVTWDRERPSKDVFAALLALDVPAVIWGGNYFADLLPPSMGWIVWDKGQRDFSLADVELAWTSERRAARCVVYPRGRALRDGKCHPTQKPLFVMTQSIEYLDASRGDRRRILDPFMGSGTTLRAAKDMGRKAIGIELDEKYCEVAAERLAQGCLPWGAEATT